VHPDKIHSPVVDVGSFLDVSVLTIIICATVLQDGRIHVIAMVINHNRCIDIIIVLPHWFEPPYPIKSSNVVGAAIMEFCHFLCGRTGESRLVSSQQSITVGAPVQLLRPSPDHSRYAHTPFA
jgi:hypothetical protein